MPRSVRLIVVGSLLLCTGIGGAEEASEAYVAQVRERLARRWSGYVRELVRLPPESPFQRQNLAVEIGVTVENDGAIGPLEVIAGPGLKGFDDAPIDLLRDLGRLPPPPPAAQSDDGRAYFRWRFLRQEPGLVEGQLTPRRLAAEEAVPKLVASGRLAAAVARVGEVRRSEPGREGALLDLLVRSLGAYGAASKQPELRAAAAAVLAYLPGSDETLLALAAERDPRVHAAGLAALGQRQGCGPCAELLVKAMATDDRATVAQALGRIGAEVAVPALRDQLGQGLAPHETAAALAALGDGLEAGKITARLLAGKGPERLAGAQAARALAEPALVGAIVAAFPRADEPLKVALVEALAAVRKKSSPELRKAIFHATRDVSSRVRAAAFIALGAMGDRSAVAKGRAGEGIADGSAEVRAAAATALVHLFPEAATVELPRLAKDRAVEVRAALAAALLARPIPSATKIVAQLKADPDPKVQRAFAEPTAAGSPTVGEAASALLEATEPRAALVAAAKWLAARQTEGRTAR